MPDDATATLVVVQSRTPQGILDRFAMSLGALVDEIAEFPALEKDRLTLLSVQNEIKVLGRRPRQNIDGSQNAWDKRALFIVQFHEHRVREIANRWREAALAKATNPPPPRLTQVTVPDYPPPAPVRPPDFKALPTDLPLEYPEEYGTVPGIGVNQPLDLTQAGRNLSQEVAQKGVTGALTTPGVGKTPSSWDPWQLMKLVDVAAKGYSHVQKQKLAAQLAATQASGIPIQTDPFLAQAVKQNAASSIPWGWLALGLLGVGGLVYVLSRRRRGGRADVAPALPAPTMKALPAPV